MKERNTYREGGERVCVSERQGGGRWRRKIKEKKKEKEKGGGGSEKIVTKPAAKTNHL